jgi:uncharacterized protein (DUF302 family)
MTVMRPSRRSATVATVARRHAGSRDPCRAYLMVEERQNALFTMRMEDMRAAYIVEERQDAVFTMRLQKPEERWYLVCRSQ